LKRLIGQTRLELIQGDITHQGTDAIVNAANNSLLGGGGVDGAIHAAAGPELLEECRALGGCKTGEAKITKGYRLKARHVIHTVGPVYHGWPRDAALLARCYEQCLNLASVHHLRSVAFPSISTGVYSYPLDEAAPVALTAVIRYLKTHEGIELVRFVNDRHGPREAAGGHDPGLGPGLVARRQVRCRRGADGIGSLECPWL
jgi:O-acetyl-ADP-ribose deacetylase (regulator of RNase III)